MASPLDVPVWEVSERTPIGDGYTPPPNAVPPGSVGRDFLVRNFRKAILVGEQLGVAVEALLATRSRWSRRASRCGTSRSSRGCPTSASASWPWSNPENGPARPRLQVRRALHLPGDGPQDRRHVPGRWAGAEEDPVVGPIRKGDHTRSAVSLLQIGELTLAFLPGEVPGELVIGLPRGIKATPGALGGRDAAAHAPPDQIDDSRLREADASGHVDVGGGPRQRRTRLHPAAVELPRAVRGRQARRCRRVRAAARRGLIDFPMRCRARGARRWPRIRPRWRRYPRAAREAVVGSCRYGQAMGRPQGHYEETNSAGWDVAADMMAAVAHADRQDRRDAGERAFRRLSPPVPTAAQALTGGAASGIRRSSRSMR